MRLLVGLAVNVWANSTSGHATIFTDATWREVGVGRAYDPVHDWCPWVAELAGP